ncbi:MAG: CHAT domain-containing protein [Cyanobacteria bacterium P01_F01_bin.150]
MHWSFSPLHKQFWRYCHFFRRYVYRKERAKQRNRGLSYLLILFLGIVISVYGVLPPNLLALTPDPLQQAQILSRQGQQAFLDGQPQMALDYWEDAETYYQQAQDDEGIWGSQLNQSKALQTLGFYRRADEMLSHLRETMTAQPPSLLKVSIWLIYGHGLRLLGHLQSSQNYLEQGLKMAEILEVNSLQQSAHLYLGNTLTAQQSWSAAADHYRQASGTATPNDGVLDHDTPDEYHLVSPLQFIAQLHYLQTLGPLNREAEILPQSQAFIEQLSQELPIQAQIYLALDFARWLLQSDPVTFAKLTPNPDTLLHTAIQQAEALGDRRAESYGWGYLGQWHEYQQRWSRAEQDTQKALTLSQSLNANELSYQWEWQQGRIYRSQGDWEEAIAHYTTAVDLLQTLRQEIIAITRDIQFSFRDQIEPIYRDLVQLLLSPQSIEQRPQTSLEQARQVLEKLQVSELNNFFREPCLEAIPQALDTIDPSTAIFYPIILPDRLAIILSIPNQKLFYYSINQPQADIERGVQDMFDSMRLTSGARERLTTARQIYDWLIQPTEPILETNDIHTLAFVLDGTLRNLPIAAIHNGTHYLVEDYQLALSPGLQLLQVNEAQIDLTNSTALVGGLSVGNGDRPPLLGVQEEIEYIDQLITSQVLLDKRFTNAALTTESQRRSFDVVHLATHAQFGETDADTFIETWNGTLKINQLRQLLRQQDTRGLPPSLLVLSACDTAQGNNRAVLGMAGLAVRSSAQSTLATLWSVNDRATATFIKAFYDGLVTKGLPKAGAVQYAQQQLIQTSSFKHPYYWAPFVLVGDWI